MCARYVAILLPITLGCGRIDFGRISTGDAGQDTDANTDASTDANGATCAATAVELCNGIDDTCDGRIDEGCPCTPFDVTLPVQTFDMISTGTGILAIGGTGILRIDGTGAVVETYPITPSASSRAQQITWTGSELAYFDPLDTKIHRLTATGGVLPAGPPLDTASTSAGIIRWNGTGYDVAFSAIANSAVTAVGTDATGTPISAAVRTPVTDVAYPFGLTTHTGRSTLIWKERSASLVDSVHIAHTAPATLLVGGVFSADGAEFSSSIASSGAAVLAVWSKKLWSFDAQLVATQVAIVDEPDRVARTSTGWDVLVENAIFANPRLVSLVHLDETFAPVGPVEPLLTVPYGSGFGENFPFLISDARATILGWGYSVDGAATTQRLIQRCP